MMMKRTRPRAAPALGGVIAGVVALATGPALGQQPLSACTTIAEPGSYVLTRNLPAAGGDCLMVAADFVTLDLAGWAIIGDGASGSAISDGEVERQGIAVRNGTVTGFLVDGVFLPATFGAVVEEVRAIGNGGSGIAVGPGSTVSGNTARANGADGIAAGPGSTVSGNTALGNAADGIAAAFGGTVSGNTALSNGGDGIAAGAGSTVSGNSAAGNRADGISAFGFSSTVSGNTAQNNGGAGIFARCPANVIGNTATSNGTNLLLDGPGCNDIANLAP